MMGGKVEPLPLRYGWGNFRPRYLQFMNNAKSFLFFVAIFAISQGMTVGGLTNVVLSTIEKRFQFTSKEAGFIAASNDISAIILAIFVSFYGGYGNKPRWLGYGALLTGIGCFLHALPHLIIGPYQPNIMRGVSIGQSMPFCNTNTTNTTSSLESPGCSSGYGGNWYYLMIFSIAQMVMGAGTTPLYSLAPAYIDENVHPKSCAVYLGVFYAVALIGPGIGFMVGGAVLSKYVDLKMPKGVHLTPGDPRWIGAWWLGYVIGGSILIFSFMALLGFPRELPGAREKRDKLMKEGILPTKDEKIKEKLNGMIPATWQLLKNPVFIFNALALTASSFVGVGIAPFIVKVFYIKFNLNPAMAGLVMGIALIPGCGGGIFLGGLLVRRFKLKESLLLAAKYCLIFKALASFGSLLWIIPGCEEVELAGIVKPYWNSPTMDNSLFSTCNRNCSCPLSQIRPVCGADKLTYFSPCFAGCTSSTTKGVYSICSCLSPSFNISGSETVRGFCDRGSSCDNYIILLVLLVSLLLIGFMTAVPNKTVVLRSVPDNVRSYALGFQFIFQRSLGFVPGPIVFGWLVDFHCLVWGQSCSRRGSCQFYDVNGLSYGIVYVSGTLQGIATLFYLISFWFCKQRASVEMNTVSKSPDEVKEITVTYWRETTL